jgi:large repetitive protein
VKRVPGQFRFIWLAALLSAFAGAAYPQLALSPAPPVGSAGTVALTAGFTTKVYAGATITATNGVGTVSWTEKGALPPGLNFNANAPTPTTATITGTPTATGQYTFVVSGLDSQDQAGSQSYSIAVVAGLNITTLPSLPNATAGANYSVTLGATGGTAPYTWFIQTASAGVRRRSDSAALPGVSLTSAGVLSGTPTQTGTFAISVGVSDSDQVNPQSDFRTFSLTVSPAPTIAVNGPLPGGTVGVPYVAKLGVQGGSPPFIWTITRGSLPQGVALFASGAISGTPTQAGNFAFTAAAQDIWGASVSGSFTLAITAKLAITTSPPLPNGAVGSPYSLQFTATGSPPFNWTVISGALPAGLTLNASTGLLSGTPTTARASQFTLQLADSTQSAVTAAFTLTIAAPLVITTKVLPDGSVRMPYPAGQNISATGGTPPYTFSIAGSLPPGLGLNLSTGAITGIPVESGRFAFTIVVIDSAGNNASRDFVINVTAIVFITTSLPDGILGTPYNQSISISGALPPDTFTVDSGVLPKGIALNVNTLSGTPTEAGVSQFVVRVTDASGNTATQAYQITVVAPPLPTPTITGVNATEPPAQQPTASIKLATPYPVDLTVTITLTFASAVGGVDDPAIQFSGGGRTVTITIPAGTTISPNITFSTGTVAGTITLTSTFQAGPQDVTPEPVPTTVIQLPPAAPVITHVTATTTSSGLEVDVTGFSNTRDMTGATFTFQAATGTILQTSQVTISNAGQLFTTWYSDPTSQQYGSRFTFAQQFTITGNMTGIAGVSVTLTNKQGTSNSCSESETCP